MNTFINNLTLLTKKSKMKTTKTHQEIWFHSLFYDTNFERIKLINSLLLLDGLKPVCAGDFKDYEIREFSNRNDLLYGLEFEECKSQITNEFEQFKEELKDHYITSKLDNLNIHINDDDFSINVTCAYDLEQLTEKEICSGKTEPTVSRYYKNCPSEVGFKLFYGDYRTLTKEMVHRYDLIFVYVNDALDEQAIENLAKQSFERPLFLLNLESNALEKPSLKERLGASAEFIFHNRYLVERNSLTYARDFLYNDKMIHELIKSIKYIDSDDEFKLRNIPFLE